MKCTTIIDKTREGKDSTSSFDYKGNKITVVTAPDVVNN